MMLFRKFFDQDIRMLFVGMNTLSPFSVFNVHNRSFGISVCVNRAGNGNYRMS